jgi:hypothetical protein
MPVAGLVKLRKHQFGRQDEFGNVIAASRAYPFKGVPSVDLMWTDPDIDGGSIDPIAPPYRGAPELTASLDVPSLNYNDLPLLLSAVLGDDVDPVSGASTARTWTHKPDPTDPNVDPMSYEFGDDVLTDWYQLRDGFLATLEITGPDGIGALSASTTWQFGGVASTGATDMPVEGTVPAPGLSVDTDSTPIYLKDGAIYIHSVLGSIATGQISNALHNFVLRITLEFDLKRWANGDQVFDVDEVAITARAIELECTFAKTADTVGTGSESDAWMDDTAQNRYIRLLFTSTRMAEGIVPYSWRVTMPARYYTRTEGEVGGNTVVVLTAHAYNEPDTFQGVIESVLVNTLDDTDLDGTGS